MSAGKFQNYTYTTNAGNLVAIKLQPETADATFGGAINTGVAGNPNSEFPSAVVSRSRRAIGIHPRTVQYIMESGMPTDYKKEQTFSSPVLVKSVWDGISKNDVVSYLGGTGKVLTKTEENIV